MCRKKERENFFQTFSIRHTQDEIWTEIFASQKSLIELK